MINIAIDGPSGAGKSTISKLLAAKLGISYIDTGAMYRALALFALDCGVSPCNAQDVIAILDKAHITFNYNSTGMSIFLNGKDVSIDIRRHEVSKAASDISKIPAVRDRLVALQRESASNSHCVLDGRDIGSNVLPHAKYKFYLTASAEERARRRYEELKIKGEHVDYNQVLKDIIDRDKNDMERAYAPLVKTDDAVLIDSTSLTIEQTVDEIVRYIDKDGFADGR